MRKGEGGNRLEEIRREIDAIDDSIADLLSKRMEYAIMAKEEKERINKPISDKKREREVIEKWMKRARSRNLDEEMMRKIATTLIEYTIKRERDADNKKS
ncbi:MAG: chorismate mutase [Candidatus Methanospirareceae archaeon]